MVTHPCSTLYLNCVIQIGGGDKAIVDSKMGEVVWPDMTDDEDNRGGGRKKTALVQLKRTPMKENYL